MTRTCPGQILPTRTPAGPDRPRGPDSPVLKASTGPGHYSTSVDDLLDSPCGLGPPQTPDYICNSTANESGVTLQLRR